MRLNYLMSCLSVVIILVMSGCLGGGGGTIPDKSIKTYLGAYEISFNLTSKYDYVLDHPHLFDERKGSSYFPDFKEYTRTIEGKTDYMDHFDVSIYEFALPQVRNNQEVIEKLLEGGKEYPVWKTYDADLDFQHKYQVMDDGVAITAACWLDEKTMLAVYAIGFDLPYGREYFNFTNILKSIRTRKYKA